MPSRTASTQPGLLERIKRAKDGFEIQALLVEGMAFQNASNGTKARWRRAVAQRREELREE